MKSLLSHLLVILLFTNLASSCGMRSTNQNDYDHHFAPSIVDADLIVMLQMETMDADTLNAMISATGINNVDAKNLKLNEMVIDSSNGYSKRYSFSKEKIVGKMNDIQLGDETITNNWYIVKPLDLTYTGKDNSDTLYTFNWSADTMSDGIWIYISFVPGSVDTTQGLKFDKYIRTPDNGTFTLTRAHLKDLQKGYAYINVFRARSEIQKTPQRQKVLLYSNSQSPGPSIFIK